MTRSIIIEFSKLVLLGWSPKEASRAIAELRRGLAGWSDWNLLERIIIEGAIERMETMMEARKEASINGDWNPEDRLGGVVSLDGIKGSINGPFGPSIKKRGRPAGSKNKVQGEDKGQDQGNHD